MEGSHLSEVSTIPIFDNGDILRIVKLNTELESLKTQLVETQPTTAFNAVVRLRNYVA